MRTEDLVTLEILPSKQVHVLITTVYYLEDNKELTRKNFRIALNVGDYTTAREYLDEQHMRVLEALWNNKQE
jgi:hypothetical protein